MLPVYDIIIPIYNGFEFLHSLFESIKKGTTALHRMIIVHDCSTDSRVAHFLESISNYKNASCIEIKVVENHENIGFVKSINLGFTFVEHDFVILNSDTQVPVGWIERLMAPLSLDKKIASATPLTNAGTICSFPRWLEDNTLAFDVSLEEIDSVMKNQQDAQLIEAPTGVGFCMGMSKKAVDEIGLFDEVAFALGYGEENDWCMRALAASYKHVIVKNLFVYHKHGASFGSRKNDLIASAMQKLEKKHPSYQKKIRDFIRSRPFDPYFFKTSLLVFLKQKPAVIFTHSWGGGARDFIFEYLCNSVGPDYILLVTGSGSLENNIQFLKNKKVIHEATIKDFSEILMLLDNGGAESFHLNHLISFDSILPSVDLLTSFLRKQRVNKYFYLHDYFSLCPTINLLNNDGIYCGVPADTFACNQCLSKINNLFDYRLVKNVSMQAWRSSFLNLLRTITQIYSFSVSSSRILSAAFPEIELKISAYQLRAPDLVSCQREINFSHKRRLKLGVLGAIGPHKGLEIIERLYLFLDKASLPIDITIIGYAAYPIFGVKETGIYDKNNLREIIESNAIDFFILPSICPETYCYTADEVMSLGYPIICFNLGAPPERIAKYSHGYLVDYMHAQALLEKIIEVAKKYGFNPSVKKRAIIRLVKCIRCYFFHLIFIGRKVCFSFLKPIVKKILNYRGVIKVRENILKIKRRLGRR